MTPLTLLVYLPLYILGIAVMLRAETQEGVFIGLMICLTACASAAAIHVLT